jgi:hypothetical protein
LQGAIYKYGVTPSTTGFSEAPVAILKALARLKWAGEEAVRRDEKVFVPFNELLLIGYYEIGLMDVSCQTGFPTLVSNICSIMMMVRAHWVPQLLVCRSVQMQQCISAQRRIVVLEAVARIRRAPS